MEPLGSTPIILTRGLCSLNFLDKPVKVPPVPAPATNTSHKFELGCKEVEGVEVID